MRRISRIVASLALLAVLATTTYAFTAPNIVPQTLAGFGSAAIVGVTVDNVEYTINEVPSPPEITAVKFTLETGGQNSVVINDTSNVVVKARVASGPFIPCNYNVNDGARWVCSLPNPTDVDLATALEVLVTSASAP